MNQRTTSRPWSRCKKRLRDLFRRTTDGGTTTDEVGGRSDGRDSDAGSSGTGGDPTIFSERIAELKLRRVRSAHAELTRETERLEAGLRDARRANDRLKVAASGTDVKWREATAVADELEAEHAAWQTAGRAQAAAETKRLTAENRGLNVALSESARWTDAAERRVAAAERRAGVAEQRIARAVEQRSTVSSAAEHLQNVLASRVTDLEVDVLRTVAENLMYALEAASSEENQMSRNTTANGYDR